MAGKGSAPGERRGGRQKGTPNKANLVRQAAVQASGITPLEYLLSVLRTPTELPKDANLKEHVAALSMRLEAAKAAAPYVHPKLANIEMSGKDGGPLEINLVQFSNHSKQLAAKGISNASVGSPRGGLPKGGTG